MFVWPEREAGKSASPECGDSVKGTLVSSLRLRMAGQSRRLGAILDALAIMETDGDRLEVNGPRRDERRKR